jgi:hypothetical protein
MEKQHLVSKTTYVSWWGFSINEGGTPINIHMNWRDGLFVYLYFFGKRFHRRFFSSDT